ncbi:hypothetical protein MMC06_002703 [Schaereria dolodes]|nr:hypothetical protein [Schaereria dolodes]
MLYFLSALLIFALIPPIFTRPGLLPRGLTRHPSSGTLDFLYSGLFRIENCGEKAQGLAGVLKSAQSALRIAISDANLGIQSHHGFNSFFKTDGNVEYIENILTKMSKGTPIMVKDGVEEVQVSPTFVCVSEDMQQSYWFSIGQGPYDLCVRTQNALAIHDEFLNVIYLCSAFLALPERPTGRNCPSIDTISNTFQGNNKTFFQYQTYVVVHELVHYYSEGQDLDLASDPPETYDWNACVALSAEASIRNPNNFKIYVAAVQQGCTDFPIPPVPDLANSAPSSASLTAMSDVSQVSVLSSATPSVTISEMDIPILNAVISSPSGLVPVPTEEILSPEEVVAAPEREDSSFNGPVSVSILPTTQPTQVARKYWCKGISSCIPCKCVGEKAELLRRLAQSAPN